MASIPIGIVVYIVVVPPSWAAAAILLTVPTAIAPLFYTVPNNAGNSTAAPAFLSLLSFGGYAVVLPFDYGREGFFSSFGGWLEAAGAGETGAVPINPCLRYY